LKSRIALVCRPNEAASTVIRVRAADKISFKKPKNGLEVALFFR